MLWDIGYMEGLQSLFQTINKYRVCKLSSYLIQQNYETLKVILFDISELIKIKWVFITHFMLGKAYFVAIKFARSRSNKLGSAQFNSTKLRR